MQAVLRVGRYVLFGEIASGGMATVHYGRQRGSAGFARIVAIKRLHPHLGKDADFRAMFLDEARIAARIQHPNAANILDVVSLPEGELLIVMEYIAGESLSRLLRRVRDDRELVPPDVATAIVCDVLQGLHAAHEAKNEKGEPLGIVHRDVSPHNVLVGADGISRIVDFGIAKASGRIHATREGQVKGKFAYMPPEQLRGKNIDRRCDIYAAGVVLWEALTAQRLFLADSEGETITNVLERPIVPPSQVVASVPRALDAVVLQALSRDPARRFATARDMASAIEAAMPGGSVRTVGSWIHTIAGDVLSARARTVADLERRTDDEIAVVATTEAPSQISSVSLTSDAPGRPKRRAALAVSVGMLLASGVVFGGYTLKHRHADKGEAAAPASSRPAEIAAAQTTGEPIASVIVARAPLATAQPTTPAAAAPAHHRVRSLTSMTAASSSPPTPTASEKCPVKTFTDSDGIVRFRRDCDP